MRIFCERCLLILEIYFCRQAFTPCPFIALLSFHADADDEEMMIYDLAYVGDFASALECFINI